MNTRIVELRTVWSVLAMEAALALPLMSLPTQGDRLTGLPGPFLLLLLLPGGYAAVYLFASLREPSSRLLAGIGLALLTRAIVSTIPDPGPNGVFLWLGRSVIPAAIGVALWWRGGALAVAELTPADVRMEFSIVAVALLMALAVIRPFLLPDPLLLGTSVGIFVVAGLIGAALSRQDAAEVRGLPMSRGLAIGAALLPAGVAVLLVSILRPQLLGSMWLLLARAVELLLTPIGWLFALLGSLFPRIPAGVAAPPPPLPTPPPIDPEALAAAQDRLAWLAWLVLFTVLLAVTAAALLAAKMLLANFIGDPHRSPATDPSSDDLVVERSGTPNADARNLFAWLMRWLRRSFGSHRSAAPERGLRASQAGPADAWSAYQRLLRWAEQQGLGRRPAETTGQLSRRLAARVPELADAVELVTRTYEWERYGAVHPAPDRLARVKRALESLTESR